MLGEDLLSAEITNQNDDEQQVTRTEEVAAPSLSLFGEDIFFAETTKIATRKLRFADESGLPLTQVKLLEPTPPAIKRLIVLLLSPLLKTFEFLHVEYPLNETTTAKILLEQLSILSTNEAFRTHTFTAIWSLKLQQPLSLTTPLEDLPLQESEICLAILEHFTAAEICGMAAPLLGNKKMLKAVHKARRTGRGLKCVTSGEEWMQQKQEEQLLDQLCAEDDDEESDEEEFDCDAEIVYEDETVVVTRDTTTSATTTPTTCVETDDGVYSEDDIQIDDGVYSEDDIILQSDDGVYSEDDVLIVPANTSSETSTDAVKESDKYADILDSGSSLPSNAATDKLKDNSEKKENAVVEAPMEIQNIVTETKTTKADESQNATMETNELPADLDGKVNQSENEGAVDVTLKSEKSQESKVPSISQTKIEGSNGDGIVSSNQEKETEIQRIQAPVEKQTHEESSTLGVEPNNQESSSNTPVVEERKAKEPQQILANIRKDILLHAPSTASPSKSKASLLRAKKRRIENMWKGKYSYVVLK